MAERTVTSTDVRVSSNRPDGAAPKASSPPPTVIKSVTLGKKKGKVSPALIVAAIAILGVVFWYFFLRAPAAPPLVTRYTAIDKGDITRSVTATGTLQATTTVQIGSQVSGLVKKIYADYNTHVRRGQLLALLDTAPYVATVTQTTATVQKAQSDVQLQTANEARARKLLAEQLIAQSDYDAAKNALQDARAVLAQDEAQLQQAKVNLGYTRIVSPVDGTVQARNVDSGQTVAAGLNVTVLYVIAEDLRSMQVSAAVDEADIGGVAVGQPVKFTVEAYPGEQFEGTVFQVRINPVTTQNVVTYSVIITTPNPDEKLLPGMTATVNIINASRTDVLRVPVAATRFVPPAELLAQMGIKGKDTSQFQRQHTHGGTRGDSAHRGAGTSAGTTATGEAPPTVATVYIKTNVKNKPQLQPVKIVAGLSDGNYTEVLNSTPPLHEGDSVIVAAFSLAPSGGATSSSPLSTPRVGGGGGGGRGGGR